MASDVGSVTASAAKGVNRFSRLLPDHVCAEPVDVTIVPKLGLAITLTHGNGVSRSLSMTIAYSRPPPAKPPNGVAKARRGVDGDSAPSGTLCDDAADSASGGVRSTCTS